MQLGTYRRYNTRRRRFTAPSFNLPDERRLTHLWVVGKTGMGKSTFLLNCITQDIRAGRGCFILDPKGDLALDVLATIPPSRRRDVIYFDPADIDFPIGFNPLEATASAVVTAFHHLFRDSWGPQLEQILKAAVLAVRPHGTLLDVKFMLTSKGLRERTVIRDPLVNDFWNRDFARHMSDKEQRDRTLSTLNKVRQFLDEPMLRNIVAQPSAFDLGDVIDDGRIFIANLAAGRMGQDNSALLGAFLISSLHSAALARKQPDLFPVYVDEAYLFGSATFAEMLSILRSFGISLTLANQYLGQLDQRLCSALIGNVGTTVAFRVGAEDAAALAPDLGCQPSDLTILEPYRAIIRTGERSIELAMPPCRLKRYPSGSDKIRRQCRNQLARPRRVVERRIAEFIAAT